MENIENKNMNFKQEADQLDAERQANYKEKFPESWKIEPGTTEFTILSDVVKKIPTENGTKALFTVNVKGQTLTWWLSVRNPAYTYLIKLGRDKGSLLNLKLSLTKVGERKGTRYEIRVLE